MPGQWLGGVLDSLRRRHTAKVCQALLSGRAPPGAGQEQLLPGAVCLAGESEPGFFPIPGPPGRSAPPSGPGVLWPALFFGPNAGGHGPARATKHIAQGGHPPQTAEVSPCPQGGQHPCCSQGGAVFPLGADLGGTWPWRFSSSRRRSRAISRRQGGRTPPPSTGRSGGARCRPAAGAGRNRRQSCGRWRVPVLAGLWLRAGDGTLVRQFL